MKICIGQVEEKTSVFANTIMMAGNVSYLNAIFELVSVASWNISQNQIGPLTGRTDASRPKPEGNKRWGEQRINQWWSE